MAEREATRVINDALHAVELSTPETRPASVRSELVHGAIVPALVDFSSGADMLVVGSRGLNAGSRAMLGSVSAGVVRRAQCPVAVIHD